MPSLRAETILTLAGFKVTNSLCATLLVDVLILVAVFLIRHRMAMIPGRLQGAAEAAIEYLHGVTKQVAGPRAGMIFPWAAVFFLFIAFSNLAGLLPGFGTVGFFRGDGFVPLFHANTSDLNVTLALASVSLVATHVLAIRTNGLPGYLRRFFSLNPLFLFVGLLELVSELTKLLSLSLRLLGNIFAGEVVLRTMGSFLAFLLPVPFLGMEMLVGIIQALIFSMLTMVFMAVLTEPHPNGGHHL